MPLIAISSLILKIQKINLVMLHMHYLLGALGIDFDFAQSDDGVDNLNIKVNDLVYEFPCKHCL